MANQLYVNVGGTWKSADNYYVNVGGTWRTGADIGTKINQNWEGMAEAAMYVSGFPTYLDIATLDLPEFTVKPIVHVNAKQGIDNDTLDYAYWTVRPFWTRASTFVYQPPSGGGGTPTNNLPTTDETYELDVGTFTEFTCKPTVYAAIKSGIDLQTLDYSEFTCKPFVGSTSTYVPTSSSSSAGGHVTALGPYSTTAGGTAQYDGMAYAIGHNITSYNIGSQDGFGVNTGTGTGLVVQVLSNTGSYGGLGNVSIVNAGSGYRVGDTIRFNHTFTNGIMSMNAGNTQYANATRAAVAGNTYNVTITNAMTSGGGSGAYFEITVNTDGSVSLDLAGTPNDWTKIGSNFVMNETITVPDSLVGNTGAADLSFSVAFIVDSGFQASRTVTAVSSYQTVQDVLPQASDIVNLDTAYWTVYPQVRAAAKAGLDSRTLDLSIFTVLPVYVSHVGSGRINQTRLQVHYDFGNTASWDGISSTTAINDLSGNNRNATLQGSTYTKDTANGGSIVLAANTTNSRFDLANALTFTNTEDFTFFVCYKYISTPSSWEVFAGNNDADNFIGRNANSFFRMQDGSNNNIDISGNTGGGQGIQSSNTNIRVLYVVKDNQTAYFYEDGVLSNGGTTNTSFSDITFSGNQYASNYGVVPFYEQKLYFWGMYDRVLTATEIADNYAVHKTRLEI